MVILVDLVQKMVKQVDLVVEVVVEPHAEDLVVQVTQDHLQYQKVILVELITEDLLPMEVVVAVEQPLLEEMQVHQKVVMEVQDHLTQLQQQQHLTVEVVEVVLIIQILEDLVDLVVEELFHEAQLLQQEQLILEVVVELVVILILVVILKQVVQVSWSQEERHQDLLL